MRLYNPIEVSDMDLEGMLIGALRYAYGRKSYAVGCTAGYLCDYVPQLHEIVRSKFVHELERLLEHEDPGMDMDKVEWECALAHIKETLKGEEDAPLWT